MHDVGTPSRRRKMSSLNDDLGNVEFPPIRMKMQTNKCQNLATDGPELSSIYVYLL